MKRAATQPCVLYRKSNFRCRIDPDLPCNIHKAKLGIEVMKNEQQLNRTYISRRDERRDGQRIKTNNQTTAKPNFRCQIDPAVPYIISKGKLSIEMK